MVDFVIDKELFVRNYVELFRPSGKSRRSLAVFIGLVLIILTGCILIHQYLGALLILVRAIKMMDDRWIRDRRHAAKVYEKNDSIRNGIAVDITDKALIIEAGGCTYLLDWGSFLCFMEATDILYLEHKFGGKYYLLKNLFEAHQLDLIHSYINKL